MQSNDQGDQFLLYADQNSLDKKELIDGLLSITQSNASSKRVTSSNEQEKLTFALSQHQTLPLASSDAQSANFKSAYLTGSAMAMPTSMTNQIDTDQKEGGIQESPYGKTIPQSSTETQRETFNYNPTMEQKLIQAAQDMQIDLAEVFQGHKRNKSNH